MKKYFLYELKKNVFIICAFTLAVTVLYVALILLTMPHYSDISSFTTFLWFISLSGGLLAAIVPVWIFSYKMKKRSVDLYYSLPLSHTKILTVKFFIGLIAVFLPYTATYWLGAFTAMAVSQPILTNAVYYLPQFFASFIPIYFIYSIAAFIFTRANSVWDGLAFMLFWMIAVPLVATLLQLLTAQRNIIEDDTPYYSYYLNTYFILPEHYYVFAPLDFVTSHFQKHLANYLNIHTNPLETIQLVNVIVGFTLTSLMSAGATVGLFLSEKRAKAENVGQISESWFGYKTMLPLATVCLLAICPINILTAITIVCSFFLTVAYRRTFKIGKVQAIVFPVSVAVGIILSIIINYVL